LQVDETNVSEQEQGIDFADDVKVGDELCAYLVSVANTGNNHRYLVALKRVQRRDGKLRGLPKIVPYDGGKAQAVEESLSRIRLDLRADGYWLAESWVVPFPGGFSVDGTLDAFFADFE